jgi:hypothetical protein
LKPLEEVFKEGKVLNSRYRVESHIGRGVFGMVVTARSIRDPREIFAIKIMRANDLKIK